MSEKQKDIALSIVIPAYNEESRTGKTIEAICRYLSQRAYAAEIIVVDDGSTDKTAEKAREALRGRPDSLILTRRENFGKGYSVREGILRTRGAAVLFTDADLSTPIEELEKFWPWLEQGYDIVIGSRALPESDIRARQSRLRETMGKMFNLFVRLLVLRGVKDTQCGFKLFRRGAALAVFDGLQTKGFSFDVEALAEARRLGFRVRQVPIVWRNAPHSKVKIIGSSLRMFLDLWRIRRLIRKRKRPGEQ